MLFHFDIITPPCLLSSLLDHLEDVAVLEGLLPGRARLEAVAHDGVGEGVGADGEVAALVDPGGEAPHHLLARALLLAVAHQKAGSAITIAFEILHLFYPYTMIGHNDWQ